jgi:potassium-dependent mechanosensitive channel
VETETMTRPWIRIGLALLLGAAGAAAAGPLADDWARRLAEAEAALDAAIKAEQVPAAEQESLTAARRDARAALERLRAAEDLPRQVASEAPKLEAIAADNLAQRLRDWERRLPSASQVDALEASLREQQEALAAQRQALQAARGALVAIDSAPLSGARASELSLRLDRLRRSATDSAADHAAIERLALELELAAVEEEAAVVETRRRLARAQIDAAQTRIAEHERKAAVLQARLAGAAESVATALVEEVTAALDAAGDDPELRLAAERNLALALELQQRSAALDDARQRALRLQQERERTANALDTVRSRLGIEAAGDALGRILLAERQRLGNPARMQRELGDLRSELAATRLRLLELPDEATVGSARSDADGGGAFADDAERLLAASRLSEARERVRERLADVLQRQLEALSACEVALNLVLSDTRELRALLDQQLLWLPSHAPVDANWLKRLRDGSAELADAGRWSTAVRLLGARLLDKPAPILLGLLVVAALLWAQPALRRRIDALAPPLRRVAEDRYRKSVQVLALSLLHSLPWPLLLAVLGHQWSRAGEPGRFSHSLGLALGALAVSLWLLSLLRVLVADRGLAHLHFRWTRARRESLATALRPAMAILLPLQFVIGLSFVRGQELAIDGPARLAAMLFAAVIGLIMWRGLAAGGWWTPRGRSEPFRLRSVLRVALPALFAGLVALLLLGYVYTASVLLRCLWYSLWTVLLVALVHGMLARWFLLGERRLAQQRAIAQRESQGVPADEALDAGEEILSLEAVNMQTSRLLRATTLTLWTAGLLWVWADVVPALDRLDAVALWQFSDTDAAGQAITSAVTLKALLLGIVVLSLTWVAARNLPGLLEIGLLSRIHIDAANRYAIASISRYLIVIVGTMVGLGWLGLRWSQLQWMAAALSVGLGFGLQEIFGNFVSGLILLFERPFRVGDVITIGEFTGTVSRIRTRATTIIDFDNKEVVIPNKTFITDRLINWTLSDSRTRIVIKVGVAYGSDIAMVHRLLRQAAAEQATVLPEPAPASWLMAFGASTLDFELRVFVDSIADRLPTTNALNTRIAELFAQHGIEIAFPQMDLHVRDVPRIAAAVGSAAIREHDGRVSAPGTAPPAPARDGS